ncbi:MAG TPA: glycosyl hydrolase family 65 protein, partial [Fimbriimonas sp.]
SKCLKQADVLMAMYLFPSRFSDDEVRQAWDYYLPYTTHDSSLSKAIHAILACRLGEVDEAWRLWLETSRIDLDGGAAEGIHIAGAGGNWLVMVRGFAGLASPLESPIPSLDPKLPAQLSRLAFRHFWKGTCLHIEIDRERVLVANEGDQASDVSVRGTVKTVPPGRSETWEDR